MKVKNIVSKARQAITAPYRRFMAGVFGVYAGALATAPTFCATINSTIDENKLFGSMADIVIKIAFYIGALIAISGLFSLLVAYKDDNAEGQTRAIRLIVVGILLVGFQAILKTAGIIK